MGRTETKPIFSSTTPSLFNIIKKTKPNNIGTSNISQTQPLEQPPPKTQEEFPPQQIKGGIKFNKNLIPNLEKMSTIGSYNMNGIC